MLIDKKDFEEYKANKMKNAIKEPYSEYQKEYNRIKKKYGKLCEPADRALKRLVEKICEVSF